jgi:ElaB/YqjD/DUF883 family membrane-anchored ribosome-binding protein
MQSNSTTKDFAGHGGNGARQAGKHAKRYAERLRRDASPDFDTLIADVEDLLQKVGNVANSEVAQVRDRLVTKVASVKEALNTQGGQFARDAAGATDDYVRENPWRTTGLAALAGMIIGYVIFRK